MKSTDYKAKKADERDKRGKGVSRHLLLKMETVGFQWFPFFYIPSLLYKGRCPSRSGKAAPLYKITCSSFGRILFLSCFFVFPGFKGLFPP